MVCDVHEHLRINPWPQSKIDSTFAITGGPRKSLGPKSTLIFFFSSLSYPDRVPSLLPASPGNPGWFTYRHFASGNFHCFAGLVNPYWGLPEPPPATHPGIHADATRVSSHPQPLIRPLVALNNLHPRAPPCPSNRPLFPTAPRKRKACGFSSRVGVGLFPPSLVTSLALPDWPMPRW